MPPDSITLCAENMTLILSEYQRKTEIDIQAVEEIGLLRSDPLFQFYESNEGHFSSSNTGFCFLDIATDPKTYWDQHRIVYEEYGIPRRYLVISDLLGNAVLMYDTSTTAVYNVDFEGGDQMLIEGTLEPYFKTLSEFLKWYFVEDNA